MKKRLWLSLLGLITLGGLLSGCGVTVGERANNVDNWHRIEKRGYAIVGLDDTFVPMGFREKSGRLVGYDVDLARAVFKLYGLKVSFQTIDWSMNATELNNGTIDAIWNGYSKTPEREKVVAFSDTYLQNDQTLVSLRKNNITSFRQMAGKTLGAQTGSSGANDISAYPKLLKNRIKGQSPVLYDSFTNAFIDLNANRIQGMIIDSTYAGYYVKHQKNPAAYRIINGQFPKEEFGVGLRKSDHTLKAKINAGLKTLAQNGTLAKINHKWFGNAADSPLLHQK
ncbi:amino acid ABC transporter substrate-binding protein [Secundilactobacillus kimchicus]|uniref:amino acid ABC transporter substrate-binding protein n=1 Tax=Secundilactobacillus kimchicus TaxID=528209 RepID=UPI0024A7EFA5|nr:amino acid ABC transporter substrate-binding protein [Secundilactobacillus kimchicus]